MNKNNIVLTIIAIILTTIIVGETYIYWRQGERTIAKNDSTTNTVSSDTTKSIMAAIKPHVKPVKTEETTNQ